MKSIDYSPIELQRTSWLTAETQLREIRQKVFVAEQNVPLEEDIDGQDERATHWLARINGKPVGTARMLPCGVIGRMAVLKEQRGKGVGSAILRQIIHFAIQQNIPQLTLGAQLRAIPFYEHFGFQLEGPVYRDAGIDHRQMCLPLHLQQARYGRNIFDSERQRVQLDSDAAVINAALTIAQMARKKIRILSDQLLPALYDNQPVCQALCQRVTQQRSAQIQALLKDIDAVSRNTHQLHELSLRLPSHIQFRQLDESTESLHREFMLVDDSRILYLKTDKPMTGYMVRHAPSDAKALLDEFDAMWQHGKTDPALRLLSI